MQTLELTEMISKFYVKALGNSLPKKIRYPAFILLATKWDDFDYKTQFKLLYYEAPRRGRQIGLVKILRLNTKITVLPKTFATLRDNYCSVGQDSSYYQSIEQSFDPQTSRSILKALNDISLAGRIPEKFRGDSGIRTSLLRDSEAQKAFEEASASFRGDRTDVSYAFEFECKIPGFAVPHKATFEFSKTSPIPQRIGAIIGKNGSGKTQYLARLATSLSGDKGGNFKNSKQPPFSRVIAISYSLFDRFKRPREGTSFSYYYCGFQSGKEFNSTYSIQSRINRALKRLDNNDRISILRKHLKDLLGDVGDEYARSITNHRRTFKFTSNDGLYTRLSSGQILLIVVLTEIICYIRRDSILLFDEPETHLHPNAISKLIGVVCDILIQYDSFALIATHSPQIIQEIPSSLIYYFDGDRNNPPVSQLSSETFGENLTTLTERIFGTQDVDEFYKKQLRELFKTRTKKEIIQLFNDLKFPLSTNVKIFLEYLEANAKSKKAK